MNFDWRLLGEGVIIKSVPRLLEQHGVKSVLPSERTLYGASLHEFNDLFTRYEEALQQLFREFEVSWIDVYLNSDVGKERVELAKKVNIDADDNVLDVGCGRGFFTLAVAEHAKSVVGLDFMNGFGRNGWWRRFKTTLKEFDLQSRVFEARGSAMTMPKTKHSLWLLLCMPFEIFRTPK